MAYVILGATLALSALVYLAGWALKQGDATSVTPKQTTGLKGKKK